MKIAITSTGKEMSSAVDPRFGRASFLMVVNTTADTSFTVHDNTPNLNAAQGAGIQAGQTVAQLGVEAVITGNVGPKAFRTLSAAGIKVYLCDGTTVSDAVRRFTAGELQEVSAANAESHWG